MSNEANKSKGAHSNDRTIDRRNLLLGTSTLVAAATRTSETLAQTQKAEDHSNGCAIASSYDRHALLRAWGGCTFAGPL